MLTHGVEVMWDGKSCRPACNPLIALLSTILLIYALDFAHICFFDCIFIGFCSYLYWICSYLNWIWLIFELHFAHICNAILIAFALGFPHICTAFCSYLQCTFDCICTEFCTYFHWLFLLNEDDDNGIQEEVIPHNCRWRGWRRQYKFFWPV